MVRSGAAVRASSAIQGGLTSRVGVGTQPVDGGGGRSGQHVASVSPDIGTPANEYPGYHEMAVAVLTGNGDTGRAVGLRAPSQYVLRARLGARSAVAIAGAFTQMRRPTPSTPMVCSAPATSAGWTRTATNTSSIARWI
jgi:hypothetical protein